MSKKKLVGFFFERNYRVTPQLLEEIPSDFNFENFLEKNNNINRSEEVIVLDNELFKKLFNFEEESIVEDNITASVEVISSYVDKPKKREVKDFVIYMKVRYNALKKILLQRSELQNAISISRLASKQAKEYVSIIGFVNSKDQTRNGHYILELEDPTGITKILISAKNKELIELMDEVVLDELVGINGTLGENIVFANEFYFPDTPLKEYKKCKDDVSAVFISDLHIGSTLFAKKEFENFIMWVNGNYGNEEQKEVARKAVWNAISKKNKYGMSKIGAGKKIIVEYSSPNIAKPLGIGQLRSTIIGNSVANMADFLGYKVHRLNYLGDWGTQFGKVLFGYEKFGSDAKLMKDPLKHLMDVYVKVNKKSLEPKAKEYFNKLFLSA